MSLTFFNYGTHAVWIHYDQTESNVHHFELLSDSGKATALRRRALKPLPLGTPLRQSLPGDSAMGLGPWELDLAELFDIPGPGTYCFRYRYESPEDRDKKDCTGSFGLRVWDGKVYADCFRFAVTE